MTKEASAKPALQKCGRMGGARTRTDAAKAAFTVQTNALYTSYFTDKICNSFHNAQNEQLK
jgi:hypothetical protein